MEIYEETPDIHKEAFVREEVKVKKVVEQETVETQETIRREELDIEGDGRTIEEQATTKRPYLSSFKRERFQLVQRAGYATLVKY